MTTSCGDCDHIPKVAGAGMVVEENGRRVQIMHNGVRVIAGGYDGDWMMEIITRLKGHHEPQEELVFHEILKTLPEQATMIELGGYWSYYTLWFLHSAPQYRRAIVVEPDPRYLDVGRMNAALNGRDIDFIQAAAGEEAVNQIEFPSQSSGPILIPQVSVASLMESRNIPCLDVLHCDTQGAEISIIKSCSRLFREKRIRFGIFSTHDKQFTDDSLTHQRCLAMIEACGGQILAEHEVHESYSGDGLITAYFGATPIDWPSINMSYNRYSNCLFRNPIYDIANAERVHTEMGNLKFAHAALAEKFNKLREAYQGATGFTANYADEHPELNPNYLKLYEALRLAQRRPTRLLRFYLKWKISRFFLRFASLLPERLVKGMQRRMRKYTPLPRLTDDVKAGIPRLQSAPAYPPPFTFYRFLTEKKYRKQATSQFLLLFSPILSSQLKRRLRNRYEKNLDCEQSSPDVQAIPAEDAHPPQPQHPRTPQLTESAQRFFEELEARFASMSSSKTVK